MNYSAEKIQDIIYSKEPFVPHSVNPTNLTTSRYDDAWQMLENATGSVLEIGCGIGQFTIKLKEKFDTVTGIDFSSVAIGRAKDIFATQYPEHAKKISFHHANAEDLSAFPDGTFDCIVALAVLEHVPNLFSAMEHISRVAKRGSRLVISVPNIAYIKHIFSLVAGETPITGGMDTRDMKYWQEEGWDGGHVHYFTRKQLAHLLEFHGFKPTSWLGDGRYAKFRRWSSYLVGNLNVMAIKQG